MGKGFKINSINYQAELGQSSVQPVLRRFLPEMIENEIIMKLWIQQDFSDFDVIELRLHDHIEIKFNQFICPVCHQERENVDHGYCEICYDPNTAFSIRMSCMFKSPVSPLVQYGTCEPDDYPCKMKNNLKYCHSKYILYIGRFGNAIKVGISRINRKYGYMQRLIEQGLNEAIVIASFPSLPDVLEIENSLIDKGLSPRLETSSKIEQLRQKAMIQLQEKYPLSMLETYFDDKDIIYYHLHEDKSFNNLELNLSIQIQGEIVLMQGNLIVIEQQGNYFAWNLKNNNHRQISKFVHNEEVIV